VEAKNRFSLLRKLLGAIGLSPEAMDDIVDRITDFISDKGDKSAGELAYPYVLSKDFLTLAEISDRRSSLSCQGLSTQKTLDVPQLGEIPFAREHSPRGAGSARENQPLEFSRYPTTL
jgi:hypothetical protein